MHKKIVPLDSFPVVSSPAAIFAVTHPQGHGTHCAGTSSFSRTKSTSTRDYMDPPRSDCFRGRSVLSIMCSAATPREPSIGRKGLDMVGVKVPAGHHDPFKEARERPHTPLFQTIAGVKLRQHSCQKPHNSKGGRASKESGESQPIQYQQTVAINGDRRQVALSQPSRKKPQNEAGNG